MAYDKPDRYGRMLGLVMNSDGKQINCEIIRAGAAWVYVKYDIDSELPAIEQEARQNKRGLWQQANVVATWELRHHKKWRDSRASSMMRSAKRCFYFASYIMKFRGQKANDLHQKNYVQREQYAACLLCHWPRSD
ncbi:thermonuclease family protein [Citrobacter portucalensis]|uniref:thermonuclease family protein n=1 Tax=Citrobacter portucalensis TaxID=1639133 RepID=UPI003D7F14A3